MKSSNEFKMMPSKSVKTEISSSTARKVQKPQSDGEIIKEIEAKAQQL